MSRAWNTFSDTYPCAAAAAIVAKRVVVMDATTKGNVKLPAATPEKTAVGVTLEKQSAGNNVEVQLTGVAVVESDGTAVINPGDMVVCGGGADGRVKAQALAAGSANVYNPIGMCIGRKQVPATAGALVEVRLQPYVVLAA